MVILLGFYIYTLKENIDLTTSFLLFINGALIPYVFLVKRRITIFEPLFWFSLYYYFLFFSSLWLINTNFSESRLIQLTSFYAPVDYVLKLTLVVVFIGYLSFLFGYELFVNKNLFHSRSGTKKFDRPKINSSISLLVMFTFITIGAINFLYNLKIVSNFSIIDYFVNIKYYGSYIGERYGLTTLGYQFYGIAAFIGYFEFKRGNLSRFFCYSIILSYFIIYASKGRITQTVTTIIIFFLLSVYTNRHKLNWSTLASIAAFGLLAISLFFYRRFTEIRRVYNIDLSDFIEVLSPSRILFGGGNLPNISALMKILDSWAIDIGYLFGQTIPSGLYVFIPSFLKPEILKGNTVSWISKNAWYQADEGGGGIPPGILGDWYANFGNVGIVLGMFLLGILFSKIYNYVLRNNRYMLLVFYLFFLIKFVFILPKGEFSRLSYILEPSLILITWITIRYITFLARPNNTINIKLQLD